MSSSEPLRNDPYGWIEEVAARIDADSAALVKDGAASRVPDEAIAHLMTAAIRLYAARTDGEERTFRPLSGEGDVVTPTEALTAVSEILRALHLGPMELALFYRRRPDEV